MTGSKCTHPSSSRVRWNNGSRQCLPLRLDVQVSARKQGPAQPEAGAAAVRQQKDPRAFKDMDSARTYLEKQDTSPGFITGVLNWIGNSSFGSPGTSEPWWTLPGLYRLLTLGGKARPRVDDDALPEKNTPAHAALMQAHTRLASLLLGVTVHGVHRMSRKCPQVLTMSAAEMGMRLVQLQGALPRCNALLLIEQYPELFLSGEATERCAQITRSYGLLAEGLRGADVAAVIMQDPEILLMDLEYGLQELHSLWEGLEPQALANSEPNELALAVRALCNAGGGRPGAQKSAQPGKANGGGPGWRQL